jgi:hypothetical protein
MLFASHALQVGKLASGRHMFGAPSLLATHATLQTRSTFDGGRTDLVEGWGVQRRGWGRVDVLCCTVSRQPVLLSGCVRVLMWVCMVACVGRAGAPHRGCTAGDAHRWAC